MSTPHLATSPVNGPCEFTASDLDGKKLRWKLQSPFEVSGAPASTMFADDTADGNVSVALRDSVESEHRDSDGNPVMVDILGVWLTPESLGLIRRCADSDSADFEAVA